MTVYTVEDAEPMAVALNAKASMLESHRPLVGNAKASDVELLRNAAKMIRTLKAQLDGKPAEVATKQP